MKEESSHSQCVGNPFVHANKIILTWAREPHWCQLEIKDDKVERSFPWQIRLTTHLGTKNNLFDLAFVLEGDTIVRCIFLLLVPRND